MKPLSLTARLSFFFALCAAVVLLGLGWLAQREVDAHFQEMDREEMTGKFSLLQALFARATDTDTLAMQMEDALVGHHHLAVKVQAADGTAWFRYGHAHLPAQLLAQKPGEVTWQQDEHAYRVLLGRLVDVGGRAHVVAIAVDISHHRQFLHEFQRTLAWAVTLAALLSAALGWAATRAGLRPLRQATRLATRLSASSLGERLPEGGQPAEIAALSTAFNAMLARLEASFARLSEFSSDIAHELRTPVSNLMIQTQVALTRARNEAEYREVLASNLEEYERLGRMIGDMLFLAQADNDLITPRREAIDLALEALRLAEFYEALAADSGVCLRVEGEAHTSGDRLMLQRALSNLIANAIRHTPAGGTVSLRLGEEADAARICVENPGDITPERLPRLFDRFYTGDAARRGGTGTGLGLAITRSIVTAHGGRIEAEAAAGVVRFVMWLPK